MARFEAPNEVPRAPGIVGKIATGPCKVAFDPQIECVGGVLIRPHIVTDQNRRT